MSTSPNSSFYLPSQLEQSRDDSLMAIHESWSAKSIADIAASMPESQVYGSGKKATRFVELKPADGEYDPEQTALLPLPVAKPWDPATYTWAEIVRQAAVPDGRMIVFPHNNFGHRSFTLTRAERSVVETGDLSPLAERYLRVCQALGVESLALVAGWSYGASTGAAFSAYAADHLQLTAHAFDEAPNTYAHRSLLSIAKALTREKGISRKVAEQSGLPTYPELLLGGQHIKSAIHLGKYGLGVHFAPPNPSITRMFQHDGFFTDIGILAEASPTATISLSNAISSAVGDSATTATLVSHLAPYPRDEIAQHIYYDGYHVTTGNPFVMAALARRALDWHNNGVEIAGRDIGSLGPVHEKVQGTNG
ncbi:MAG: hypothetical protein WBP26_02620 [Candidatus Saccharimonadales bacterium]